MASYGATFYSQQLKPLTDYPAKLCRYLIERFNLPSGGRVLDVGCGRGDCLLALHESGYEVYGLDKERFDSALLANIDVRSVNIERAPFPYEDNFFDVVFSKSVIEHLHNPDNYMREIKRILRPGGRAIIMTPDWQTQRYIFYNDYTHVQPYIVSGLANLLRAHDFVGIESCLFYQLPLVWRLPWLVWLGRPLQWFFPIKKMRPSGPWRWSRELMILGSGLKQ